ncbi:hypothetical protein QEH59_18465 [Coraliomargarita sp. SDUM461004]|uniref:Uncharacterized protein n=1 Tax=Thalassobacterium sedimentorum TaxID=3041258 RepID=A0ABU1ANP6_9BACT|nr:hypothetical protein [Coraliomargarita sp. SDUM461004]MDQ8196419.1 hypothetical protein [Coraliomargarita sp. SDUM461004]
MKSPEDRLRKRIKNMRWGRWLVLALGVFHLIMAGVVFGQGKRMNEIIDRTEYGTLFWKSVDVKKSYTGWEVKAEERYSTSVLYATCGIFLCALGLSSFLVLKRQNELLQTIEELKREPAGTGQPM